MKINLPKINLKKKSKRIRIDTETDAGSPKLNEAEKPKKEKKAKKELKLNLKSLAKKPKNDQPKKDKPKKEISLFGKKAQKSDVVLQEKVDAPNEDNKKGLLIKIAIAVVAVAVIGGLVYFLFFRDGDKSEIITSDNVGNISKEEVTTDKNEEKEQVKEEKPKDEEGEELEVEKKPHSDVVYNTDLWYDDANWKYDNSYYTDFNYGCDEDGLTCVYTITDSLVGSKFVFETTSSKGVDTCTNYLCTNSTTSYSSKLSNVQITYPDGTVGGKYSAKGYSIEDLSMWDLLTAAMNSDMKNKVTNFKSICATARKEGINIVDHNSDLVNNEYNEVIVYVRSCRYAGIYK